MQDYKREHLIQLLCNNDPNGCYTDEECELEGLPHITLEQAYNLCIDQELIGE